jgi:hypothetical protein
MQRHNTILGKPANAKFLGNRHNAVPATHGNIFLCNRHDTIPGWQAWKQKNFSLQETGTGFSEIKLKKLYRIAINI